MARYRVQGPDGKVYVFEGPDGAKAADVEAFAAQTFGGRDARLKAQQEADRKLYDPTKGQSFGENVLQGTGAGLTSVLRAVGGGRLARAMGLPDTKEEAAQLDAPLDATAGGTVGRVVGTAAPAALAIPFTAPTLAGAAVAGGLTGAALTEGGLGDRAIGGAMGGAGGAAGHMLPAVGRTARGLYRGITEPLTPVGRDRIAGRAIERFATDPAALGRASGAPTVTGARPTLAEATRDPGMATLQRAIGTVDPEAAAALAAREQANNAARIQTLRTIAGDPAAAPVQSNVRRLRQIANGPTRKAAEGARSAAARTAYGDAFAEGVDPNVAHMMQPQIDELLSRPSIQQSVAQAQNLAKEVGLDIPADGLGSVQGLHYLKKALDDVVDNAQTAPRWRTAVEQTSRDLGSVLDEIAPAYQAARAEYHQLSVPVNRQAVGQRLLDATTGAERDFAGNRTLKSGRFAQALNDEQTLLRQAGADGGGHGALDEFMTPTQTGRIGAIRDELETLANLDRAANGKGAQTAKMLASQNLLRQVAGPLGLPEGFVDNVVSQTLLRPLAWGAQAAERRVGARIGDALLDPDTALGLVRGARAFDAVRPQSQIDLLLRRSAPAAIGYGAANAASQ